jgi:hypothetical protein
MASPNTVFSAETLPLPLRIVNISNSAHDTEHNNAVALKAYLEARLKEGG